MIKTTKKASLLSKYSFSEGECLFIDTNVWIYVNPISPRARNAEFSEVYSAGIESMVSARSILMTNVLILSEYLNLFSRISWRTRFRDRPEQYDSYQHYKDFRRSNDFRGVARSAVGYTRRILAMTKWIAETPSRQEIDETLDDFVLGKMDFNDCAMACLCRRNGWKIVTHDRDFRHAGVEVITENKKLINDINKGL